MKKFNNIARIFSIALLIMAGVAANAQTQAVVSIASTEKKVAILPITYVGDGNDVKMEEMRYRLQNIAYQYLRGDALDLKFQDPAETNAMLLKKGVNESNFREFSPKEIAALLQVEYVLTGMVSQDYTGEATVRHSNGRIYERKGKYRKQTTGHSRTRQELSTNIGLDIYNDKGENIYSKSRRSILSGVDAYKYGIQYLLKRSPLYKR